MKPIGLSATRRRDAQAGVGLIEVLIAMLVLSLGMLGLAGLQMWSLKNNQSSMERSLAVVQTYTIVDAMRADRAIAIAGGFNDGGSGASDFAVSSLATWRGSLVATLGSGASGAVNCRSDDCTITVRWNDQRAAAAGNGTDRQQVADLEITTRVRL
ncbi:MAG: type IV pilus modification protein PilV [Pseudomonadota bacterium]|nr:type IV pilus modification protein PilV [Pseudomonadota bacterium]